MSETKEKEDKPVVAKTAVDLQRLKLMKLMKNPEKPVVLPERPKAKNTPTVPEFVRNVMGSSAGAGSGEFHVYRHLRRKEYARQKFIQEKGRKETLDDEYHLKLEQNKVLADEVTAKKRAKRLKRKQKWKEKKKMRPTNTKKDEKDDHTTTEDESSDEMESENVCVKSVPEDIQKSENVKDKCETADDTNQSREQSDNVEIHKDNVNNDQSIEGKVSTNASSDSKMKIDKENADSISVSVADTS